MDVHELTAGYALDALDPAERERYEEHLSSCQPCREELEGFRRVSGALAHAAGGPIPPAALRAAILDQARSERSNVVPLRRRYLVPAISGAAAIAAVAALAVGFWATSVSRDLDDARSDISVLGDPNARYIETVNGEASLVVRPSGEAALVVRELEAAPAGMDYEIWVFDAGTARRAGLFERPGVARLTRPVAPGQLVMVTLEVDGGTDAPTSAPLFTAANV